MTLMNMLTSRSGLLLTGVVLVCADACLACASLQQVPRDTVPGQPLAANVARLLDALEYLGHPFPDELTS